MRRRTLQVTVSAFAAAALAALLLSGCGAPSAGTPSQIIKKAIDAQGKLNSVHVDVTNDIEVNAPGGDRTSSLSYKGSFEKPDRWTLTIRAGGSKSDVIIIGERTWLKSAGSDKWVEKTSQTAVAGAAPGDVVAAKYLSSARGVRLLDTKDDLYHLTFDLDMLSFAKAFNLSGIDPTLFKAKEAHMEIWVRQKDLYLSKATMDFSTHLAAPANTDIKMNTEVEFSNFNEPVSIEPPI
jgi:outer membrane lipoprotein-sorting protein